MTIKIIDNQGAQGVSTTAITVNNTLPIVSSIFASTNPVQVNTETTAQATFRDRGILDGPFTVVWHWGDNTTTTLNVSPTNPTIPLSISAPHTYTVSGVYEISLSVTDKDGGIGNAPVFQYLSVYNPTPQGLFSAASKYTSPVGAYPQNSGLSGAVTFGLSYKYQGNIPTGNREFSLDFTPANFHFNATTVSSLVITNGIGRLQGMGTVNGSGTYNYLVVGNEANDTIRVKITSENGSVIYDTQIGAPDTASPTIHISGNVLAH